MTAELNFPAAVLERPDIFIPGVTGPVGATGPDGPQGESSATGHTGPTGETGPPSELGATGPEPLVGVTGPHGPTGSLDLYGGTGQWGEWGEWGKDGSMGPTGPTGRAGPAGVNLNPPGITGVAGGTGAGSIGGLQVPFFGDRETYLTMPCLPIGQGDRVSWAYRDFNSSTIYLVPVFVPYARAFTEMVVDSYRADIYDSFRLGIYDCTEDMHPTVPVFNSASLTPIGIGRIAINLPDLVLQAKPYYLALLTNATLTFRCFGADEVAMTLGWRKYADNSRWMFEVQTFQTNTFYSNYNAGFTDLTNEPLYYTNNYLMAGIR